LGERASDRCRSDCRCSGVGWGNVRGHVSNLPERERESMRQWNDRTVGPRRSSWRRAYRCRNRHCNSEMATALHTWPSCARRPAESAAR